MLSLIRKHNKYNCQGFSLIEAMVATAILGIGLTGVFSLTAYSEISMQKSLMRQKMQMTANQILEIMESDLSNIDSYSMNLTTCTDPSPVTTTSLVRGYEWCLRLSDTVGAAQAGDTRSITVTTLGDGRKSVQITLEARNGNVQLFMTRVFDN